MMIICGIQILMINLQLVEPKKLIQENFETGRTYLTENGDRYPSVTTVLGELSSGAIEVWKQRVGEEEACRISKNSSNVGNVIHNCCENYMLGIPLPRTTKPIMQLFKRMIPSLERVSNVYGIELPMWSDYLKLAGTSDLVGEWDNELAIIDFKNSRKLKNKEWIESYFLQGAAYSRMFYEHYGMLPKKIVIIVTTWQGQVQVFEEKVADHYPRLIEVMKEHNPLWVKK